MTRIKILGLTAAALGLVLAGHTEVRGADMHFLRLSRPMVVAGVDLRAAVYSLQWELQGNRATVTFARKGRVVATVQGESTTFDRSIPRDTLYFSKQPDGFFAVQALAFASTNKGIAFPVVRSHPHPAPDIPLGNSLMQGNWDYRTRIAP